MKTEEKKPYHHGDLRQAIMVAVLAQIERDGPESVSLRAASRAVGVSPGAVFRHFPDKRAVFTALAAEGFRDMGDRIDAEAREAATAMARFGAAGRGYLLWALANPARFRLMFRADFVDADDPVFAEAGARVRAALSHDLPAVLPPGMGEAETRRRGLLAWGAVHGIATLAIEGALGGGPNRPSVPPPEELGRTLAAMEPVFVAPPGG